MNLYASTQPTLTPRPYQAEAIDALDTHVRTRPEVNPCVVLPTGAGKSPTMAWVIERWKREYPALRVVVLAHVKELVAQNADKMGQVWPDLDVGVYAAGLRRRDMTHGVTFASIDSVYNKAHQFDPFDIVIVDEAHRIPAKGEGKYRTFIEGCKLQNPRCMVIGFTATPYRMGMGSICHPDHVLHETIYEANVADLITAGYLAPLRSKAGSARPDLADVHKRGGEYVAKELSAACDRPALVTAAVREAQAILTAEGRRSVLYFCVDVDHCTHVAQELRRYGVNAPTVTGKTPPVQRDRITADFVAGRVGAIANVNVLTEGFDAPGVDAVVLLRPTESKGLYSQMVGRGLRWIGGNRDASHAAGKTDCLVLDFAGTIDTHGPIDVIDPGDTPQHTCHECAEVFSRAVGVCPDCGTPIPKVDIEAAERAEAERKMHEARASERAILSTQGEELNVDAAVVERHRKPGAPDSLRVTYRCGVTTIREWVCLDHEGYAGQKARKWWSRRFGDPVPSTDDALDLLLDHKLGELTESITVKRKGKYDEITSHKLTSETVYGIA